MKKCLSGCLLAIGLVVLMVGCKSDSSDDDDSGGTEPAPTDTPDEPTVIDLVAVDPYISGARFCVDADASDACEDGELLSTLSDAAGKFGFTEEPADGSAIVTHTRGNHNGVPYQVDIKGLLDTAAEANFITPLTTLNADGLTPEQIATMLETAGLDDITTEDIVKDPMESISGTVTEITDVQLARIRASIAAYTLLRIMDGSSTLKGLSAAEKYLSATTDGPVYSILSTMVDVVKKSLSSSTLETIKTQVSAYPQAPPVTAEDIVRTAVAIADRLSSEGYETCNATDGDVEQALSAVAAIATTQNITAWSTEMGQKFYSVRNKAGLAPAQAYLPQTLKDGMACESGTFIINATNAVECYQP